MPIRISCVAALVLVASSAHAAQVNGIAYGQFTYEDFGGSASDAGFDRMRVGLKGRSGAAFGGFVLDFNAEPTRQRPTGTLINGIKDVYAGYRFSDAAVLKAGQFKTPVGLDFNTPGNRLDITKRGLEKPLVLERNLGIMLSGRDIAGGIGYDIGLFNPAGRSGAVFGGDDDPFDQEGEDLAYAGRLHWDVSGDVHLEVSHGRSEDAGGMDASRDYHVTGVAGSWAAGDFTLKWEYLAGRDLRGVAGSDQDVYYLHGGWRVRPVLELVVRHYKGDADTPAGESQLANAFYGVNVFLGSERANARLQINYLDADRDGGAWTGIGGFTSDALLMQLQLDINRPFLGG